MHPSESTKAAACIEVLTDVIHSGVLVAKLVFRGILLQISRHDGSATQDSMDNISKQFEDIIGKIEIWGSEYSTKYERIGGKMTVWCNVELIRTIEGITDAMESHVGSLRKHVNQELYHLARFQNSPTDSIVSLGKCSESMFCILEQMLISVSPQAQMDLLTDSVRRNISSSNRTMLEISNSVNEHKCVSNRPEVQRVFERIGRVCSSILMILRKLSEQSPPSQIAWEPNDPRPVKEADDESEKMR